MSRNLTAARILKYHLSVQEMYFITVTPACSGASSHRHIYDLNLSLNVTHCCHYKTESQGYVGPYAVLP